MARTMIGGDFVLGDEELDDVMCIVLSVDDARAIVSELETDVGGFMTALDKAQGDAGNMGRTEYILIRVR
jgi:hypothetical protein